MPQSWWLGVLVIFGFLLAWVILVGVVITILDWLTRPIRSWVRRMCRRVKIAHRPRFARCFNNGVWAVTPLHNLNDALARYWAEVEREGRQSMPPLLPIPQTMTFVSPSRYRESWYTGTTDDMGALFRDCEVYGDFFFVPCSSGVLPFNKQLLRCPRISLDETRLLVESERDRRKRAAGFLRLRAVFAR